MPRETNLAKRERALEIEERMLKRYGEGECSLDYITPFQLTVAVILSAQCTDAAVNRVTPTLFRAYPTPEALAQADIATVEDIIHPLGFFRNKARNIVKMSQSLMVDFGGEVPNDLELLQTLPGVGRKTANVVMAQAFRNAQGIAVDTHVFRIAHRLRLAGPSADTPAKTEQQLLKVYPKKYWLYINHQWVHFGREFCRSQRPRCADCFICDLCPTFSNPGAKR
ncbi:MAG: endonuclease III [Eggerthellaceae bacterium]|jgi:endonuclease-3